MAKKKGIGVSTLTNRIYYGTQDTEKCMWVGGENRYYQRCNSRCVRMVHGEYGGKRGVFNYISRNRV